MKDHRFIELVNLYVDRQITAAEAEELEAEMQGNPRRRAIYRQYCQMHRATALVYDSFRANASEQRPAESGENVVVARFVDDRQARHRTPWAYYAGGLAAACLAVVFVVREQNSRPVELISSAPAKASAPAVVAVAPLPAPAPAKPVAVADVRMGPVSLRTTNLAGEQDYAAMLRAMRREEQRDFANAQIQSAQLPSLFEDGVFESPQVPAANSRRSFRPAQGEFTAYQFQR